MTGGSTSRPTSVPGPGHDDGDTESQTTGGARASGYTVASVARRLGVAAATLRTWDRRYGLGPSSHVAGAHRRYTGEDVDRLLLMRELTLDGVAPAEAARTALAAGQDELRRRALAAEDLHDDPEVVTSGQAPAAVRPVLRAIAGGRDTGAGRDVSPAVDPHALVTEIVDAAIAYDESRCDELLRIAPGGDPAAWWADVVEPARQRLLARVVLAGPGEAPEVLLNNATLHALRVFQAEHGDEVTERSGPPVSHPSRLGRIVLVFSAIGEPVPVVAHALAAALVAHGVTARVVTGPAGAHRSIELVTMVQPVAVVTVSGLTQPPWHLVEAIHEAHPSLPIFVGLGREQDETAVPLAHQVHRARSFPGLLHEVLAVAEG
ncbi:transcriptional regulator [Luteimicrobium album]|uniref:Transcriptional regulator n=1 Tax=Luteimicrobium album TaxID=1054550 RepID=A0ABQ6HY98_9MICO|nr:transcriptional regulator [Luteimicrobium album]